LDRIIALDYDTSIEYVNHNFDGDSYYENTIGVTVMDNHNLQDIVLKIDRKNAPYIITKPFHHSQKVIETIEDGSVIFSIRVHLNFELERLIMGFGETIEVIKPRHLRSGVGGIRTLVQTSNPNAFYTLSF